MTSPARRRLAVSVFVLACLPATLLGPGSAASPELSDAHPALPGMTEVKLADGDRALVDRHGNAMVVAADGAVTYRKITLESRYGDLPLSAALPSKAEMRRQLQTPRRDSYAPDEVVVVLAGDASLDGTARSKDSALDAALRELGATAAVPVLSAPLATGWSSRHQQAERLVGHDLLDLAAAYRVTISDLDPRDVALELMNQPGVSYASPAWAVHPTASSRVSIPESVATAVAAAADTAPTTDALALPRNDAIRSNAQSAWNSPGLDAAVAYDKITRRFGELPGTGEIITTVAVASINSDIAGPCGGFVDFFGPTTTVIDAQRYLDLPAMPLIPTYTADAEGNLDPLGESCVNDDPLLSSAGLALSTMAPLPRDLQRPEAPGSGLTDLLGLVPGAEHRLVAPQNGEATTVDLAGALIAAAQQEPAPTVITVSADLGGEDVGFPNRYLEDDPLLRSVIATIVHGAGITTTVAAGDGITTFRATAYGPSGGAPAIHEVRAGDATTTLNDLAWSTADSGVTDSGAIAVGSTTLNDLAARPPHLTDDPSIRAQQVYPTVRWTGSTAYASGRGSRVDLAAPGDSILSISHAFGGGPRDATPTLSSSTTAAAAEAAAAAAIVRQVSRLAGRPITDPRAIRDHLRDTADEVPDVAQGSEPIQVGPQINLNRMIDAILGDGEDDPGVLRVAVAQRRPVAGSGAVFETWTDPAMIDMDGPLSPVDGQPTGRNARAWITIAPDWVDVRDDTYALRVQGRDGVLATTRSARLQPAEILAAAGLPLVSDQPRTVRMVYEATLDSGEIVSAPVRLTFGPYDGTTQQVLAPEVDPVITGETITVTYDLTGVEPVINPELVVSFPGRPKPEVGPTWVPALQIPLDDLAGTVQVPVDDLEGGGIYGIAVNFADLEIKGFPYPLYSDFAFTRVSPVPTEQPPAPLLFRAEPGNRAAPGHVVRLPHDGKIDISWDVRGVPGATGSLLEVSAAGPTIAELRSTFNNPEGTERDDNGNDTGSVAVLELRGSVGHRTFDAADLDLYSTMSHGVRVLPVGPGGDVVGAASPVSTILRDGVRPLGGGSVELGYGLDPRRGRGLLTVVRFADQTSYASVQTFDTEAMTVTGVPLPETADRTYVTPGAGVYGGATGLVQEINPFGPEVVGQWAVPGLGDQATRWQPPRPGRYSLELGGADLASKRGAFVLRDNRAGDGLPFRLALGTVASETFGPVRDISEPLSGLPATTEPFVTAYDHAAGTSAIAYAYDLFAPPPIELVDVRTGNARLLQHDAFLYPSGLDVLQPVDGDGLLAFTTMDGLLTASALDGTDVRSVPVPDGAGSYVAADDPNGLLLVAQANADPAGLDKNALSLVRVYDQRLELVASIDRFNLYNTPLSAAYRQLQVDPATRTGWFVGPLQQQLAVFAY